MITVRGTPRKSEDNSEARLSIKEVDSKVYSATRLTNRVDNDTNPSIP